MNKMGTSQAYRSNRHSFSFSAKIDFELYRTLKAVVLTYARERGQFGSCNK